MLMMVEKKYAKKNSKLSWRESKINTLKNNKKINNKDKKKLGSVCELCTK